MFVRLAALEGWLPHAFLSRDRKGVGFQRPFSFACSETALAPQATGPNCCEKRTL
jgi:hypothetical protein